MSLGFTFGLMRSEFDYSEDLYDNLWRLACPNASTFQAGHAMLTQDFVLLAVNRSEKQRFIKDALEDYMKVVAVNEPWAQLTLDKLKAINPYVSDPRVGPLGELIYIAQVLRIPGDVGIQAYELVLRDFAQNSSDNDQGTEHINKLYLFKYNMGLSFEKNKIYKVRPTGLKNRRSNSHKSQSSKTLFLRLSCCSLQNAKCVYR